MALGHVLIDLTELVNRLDAQFAVLERIAALQAQILTNTKKILKQEELAMSKADDLTASVDALNKAFADATDEVARDLEAARKELADLVSQHAGGLTADEVTAFQSDLDTRLGAAAARLVELGKDPTDPIPE